MSKNTEYIYSNQVVVGEDQGTPYMVGRNEKLKSETDIVGEDRTPVITFNDSTNTIDFHNKSVVNFTGSGSGGGDVYLAGGTSNTTPQVFTGFNRMTNDLQLQDHLLFSDDGITEKAKISSSASEMKIITDTNTDIISMKLGNGGSTNTLELKQDPLDTSQNGLFLRQNGSGSTLDKVLTNSSQDLGVIVDSVEASPNTFTNTNTFSTQTTLTGIVNSGGLTNSNGMVNSSGLTSDVITCQGLLTTQSLNATQNITGNQLLSNGNITCGVGSNFIVGSTQIASGNLSDVSSLLNTSATAQVKTGNLQANQLTASGGSLSFTVGDGANIQNDTTNNVLVTSTTNATDGMNWRLGTGSDDTLKLRYDANGGGAGIPRYFLEMIDPSIVSDPPTYFSLTGNSTYDIANLIALLNNTSLTFNPTTTLSAQGTLVHIGANASLCGGTSNGTLLIGNPSATDVVNIEASVNFDGTNTHTFGTNSTVTFNGQINYPQPTFTTFASAGYYIGSPTTFVDVTSISRFPVGILTETYGTTSKITMRGCCELRAGGLISANTTIASLPVSARPSVDVVVAVQGQSGTEQGRVDFLSNGNVQFIGPDATFSIINFSQISYFLV